MDALEARAVLAGMGISLADPGGPIEAVKETAATLKSVVAAADGDDHGELVQAIARDVRDDASRRKTPMAGFKPASGATAGVEILDELREVDRLVAEKATADEAEKLRAWLLAVAQDAANAAKEGGFMASTPCGSARASSGCSTSCARRSAHARAERISPACRSIAA